jgi:hypothetical protein
MTGEVEVGAEAAGDAGEQPAAGAELEIAAEVEDEIPAPETENEERDAGAEKAATDNQAEPAAS